MIELDGYSEAKQVGSGGQAKVYAAIQDSFQRQVAVKVLLPQFADDPEFAQRFLREARTVAGLSHPHIIPVYDFGQKDGTFFMTMDYLAGGDLADLIKNGLKEDEILQIISQVSQALHFAHEKGYIHRDVKPDNIMFREDGSAVLTDFGIARAQDASNQLTVVGQVLGTPKYMSPEQLQGKDIDGRADIYSLGIMLYQMFTQKVPYEDPDFMTLAMKHMREPIPNLPRQFAKYQRLFERMVAKEKEKRFQSCDEVVEIIADIRSGKIDAGAMESGNAAVLKRATLTMEQQGKSATQASEELDSEAKKVLLPRDYMIALQDLDPLFDLDWKKTVTKIFNQVSKEKKKYVYKQFLEPKGIIYEGNTKAFVFHGRASVLDMINIISNIKLQNLAKKVQQAEEMLQTANDAVGFADVVESTLGIIDRFNPQDDLQLQKEKIALKNAFLDDVVLLVRNSTFKVPENHRGLTIESIRAHLIYVFIRQQLLGYRYKTLSLNILEKDVNTFVSDFVAKEARIRQCEVVHAEGFLFVIGPVKNMDQNPYSARRFLLEESVMRGSILYFNVIPITINKLSDEKEQQFIREIFDRIVTLERQLSAGITELVNGIEKAHRENLLPMLQAPVDADGTAIEKAIEKRLLDYERSLSILVLGKMPHAITELAQTTDDFEFLFMSLRRLIIDIACDVRDFSAQSTTVWSVKAEELDWKMMSYLALLDKRKADVFVAGRSDDPDPSIDTELIVDLFMNVLDEREPVIKNLKAKLKEVVRKQEEPKSAFMRWIEGLLGLDKKQITPDEMERKIESAKHKGLINLIKICKKHPKITVYLEFEGLVDIDEKVRHYAVPKGDEGLGRLPSLLTLHEERSEFEIGPVRKALEFDIFNAAGQKQQPESLNM